MLDTRGFEIGSREWEQGFGWATGENFLLIRGASPTPWSEVDLRIKLLSQILKQTRFHNRQGDQRKRLTLGVGNNR